MDQTSDIRAMIDAMGVIDSEEIMKIRRKYNRMMMEYQCAIMEIATKLNVLNNEFAVTHNHNPILTIKTRLKKPDSIIDKLRRKNCEFTLESIENNITDIAGVRVICSFPEDIYTIADLLLHQDDIKMLEIKDYIKRPKASGYRSLHLIVQIPIFLSEGKRLKVVEVQCRTIAMDFWASVEHQLKYKKDLVDAEMITRELRECADIITSVDYRMQKIRGQIEYISEDERKETTDAETEAKDERIFKTYKDRDRTVGSSHDYLRSFAHH
jgi:putative GTP pyrophosphokinase